MQVRPINNFGYDYRGNMLSNREKTAARKRQGISPIDAVTVDLNNADVVEIPENIKDNYCWLADYIKNIPDSVVNEKIKDYRDSFETVENFIVEKLLIEEI